MKEKRASSRAPYKCSRRSAGDVRGAGVGIYANARVRLSLLADTENPHNSHLFSDDQSIEASVFVV